MGALFVNIKQKKMKNIFNSIRLKKPNRNAFDLTHDVKMSIDMGKLYPVMVSEVIPGDKFKIAAECMVRFAPMIAPVMHRFDLSIHYFFVPNRIIWPNWEKWITGNEDDVVFPFVNINNMNSESRSLLDYMGVPHNPTIVPIPISALPLAAYQCIYNEYYRDQNLITEVSYKLTDGDNSLNAALFTIRRRAWEHDYFTAALPFAQKGPAVDIPLGDVTLKDDWDTIDNPVFQNSSGGVSTGVVGSNGTSQLIELDGGATSPVAYDPRGTLQTEPTTINDLRRAFRLQEWLEKNARAGTRYVESILAHFGVKSSDARLQRPEYITGIKSPITISEVLNTTGESAGLPQGNMAGHGIGYAAGNYGSYYAEEHGYIIGIMSVMPKTAYQQGIPKHFMKKDDRFQFYWPEFANIGEQEVKLGEVYIGPGFNDVDATFGYVPRYAEYRFLNSRVAGDFKTSLNYWHMGRIFDNTPALNQQFVECNPGKRIFAVEEDFVDSLYCHVLNKVTAIRPIPKFGTPTM